jgi:hypothetical protein
MNIESNYNDRLNNFPAHKQGRHPALLGVANLGIMAGKTLKEIHDDLRRATERNPMPDSEISAAIRKASSDHGAGSTYRPQPRPAPLIPNGKTALQRIIGQTTISEDVDLWDSSPIRLNESTGRDSVLVLKTHFRPWEFIYIGGGKEVGVLGQNIRTASEWIAFFEAGGTAGPYIIVNPLSGEAAAKKDGDGETYRGDGNVKTFRHCLIEFDTLPREEQIRFWSAAKLPILALIDSGGKSIHCWLDVQKIFKVTTADEWNKHIKCGLYEQVLVPLGVDRVCCNPSRLSRLPGHFREEHGKFQRLLWLSPVGREVT